MRIDAGRRVKQSIGVIPGRGGDRVRAAIASAGRDHHFERDGPVAAGAQLLELSGGAKTRNAGEERERDGVEKVHTSFVRRGREKPEKGRAPAETAATVPDPFPYDMAESTMGTAAFTVLVVAYEKRRKTHS